MTRFGWCLQIALFPSQRIRGNFCFVSVFEDFFFFAWWTLCYVQVNAGAAQTPSEEVEDLSQLLVAPSRTVWVAESHGAQAEAFLGWPTSSDWSVWGYKGPAFSAQLGTVLKGHFSATSLPLGLAASWFHVPSILPPFPSTDVILRSAPP